MLNKHFSTKVLFLVKKKTKKRANFANFVIKSDIYRASCWGPRLARGPRVWHTSSGGFSSSQGWAGLQRFTWSLLHVCMIRNGSSLSDNLLPSERKKRFQTLRVMIAQSRSADPPRSMWVSAASVNHTAALETAGSSEELESSAFRRPFTAADWQSRVTEVKNRQINQTPPPQRASERPSVS